MERKAFNCWGATDGDNPLYKSYTDESSSCAMEYDEVKSHPEPSQDHYDEPSKCQNAAPTDYRTTSNALYDSRGDTLVHPAITMDRQVPTPKEQKQQNKSKKGHVWKCSIDVFIIITSIFVILLSVVAIVIALLIYLKIITMGGALPSQSASISRREVPQPSCDCQGTDEVTVALAELEMLRDQLNTLSTELNSMELENDNVTKSKLAELTVHVKRINDSIEQVKPRASQPRTPVTSGLTYQANLGATLHEGCVTTTMSPCEVQPINPVVPINHCRGGTESALVDGKIITNFICQLKRLDDSTDLINGGAVVERLINDDSTSYFDAQLQCICLNRDTVAHDCVYYVTRCPLFEDISSTHFGT